MTGSGRVIYDKPLKNSVGVREGRLQSESASLTDVSIIRGVVFFSAVRGTINPAGQKLILIQPGCETGARIAIASKGGNNDGFDVFVYEDTTFSSNGTPLPIRNLNRMSANTNDLTITEDPVVSVLGDEIFSTFVTSGGGPPGEGGLFIMNPDRNYLFDIQNNGSGQDDFFFSMKFAEDPGCLP